jgi:hypothetical protein
MSLPELLKPSTGHQAYFASFPYFFHVYMYDPTDDGPEVNLIRFFRHFPDGHKMAPVVGIGRSV